MVNVTLVAPSGTTGTVSAGTSSYVIGTDGLVTVDGSKVPDLLKAGFRFARTASSQMGFGSPLPADLVSVSAAAIATNRVLTIAAQVPQARKLQIRQVIVTAITAGVLTIVGTDQDGNAVTETVSLVASVTATKKSLWAYATITSLTVTGLVGGGDGTLGLGVSNDFGLCTSQNVGVDLVIVKATRTGKVLGTSNTTVDDVASTAVVDVVARTVAPTTAPAANGLNDYEFLYTYAIAD